MKAVPTEYKGVVFDSKSEAVFARLLELSGIDLETDHPIRHDGHEWDFLVWSKSLAMFHSRFDNDGDAYTFYNHKSVQPVLIELKPSRPTAQYIENLKVKTDWVQAERRIIVWGNPFGDKLANCDGELCIYQAIEVGMNRSFAIGSVMPLAHMLPGVNEALIGIAASYRFDLASERK